MEKILNILKYNTYGLTNMINKYIYMKREDSLNKIYYIYHITNILNEKYPICYECNKGYCLIVPKDHKKLYTNKFNNIELQNSDILYSISTSEYLKIFKIFVECENSNTRITDYDFEN